MKESQKKILDTLVSEFKSKLAENKHSLKWWHGNNVSKICRYKDFAKQIKNVEFLRVDVLCHIEYYIKK